jgi:hypothetical protein
MPVAVLTVIALREATARRFSKPLVDPIAAELTLSLVVHVYAGLAVPPDVGDDVGEGVEPLPLLPPGFVVGVSVGSLCGAELPPPLHAATSDSNATDASAREASDCERVIPLIFPSFPESLLKGVKDE